jgi:hypothetical protein
MNRPHIKNQSLALTNNFMQKPSEKIESVLVSQLPSRKVNPSMMLDDVGMGKSLYGSELVTQTQLLQKSTVHGYWNKNIDNKLMK